jgi:NADH-quinone oxidoreductase subunit G
MPPDTQPQPQAPTTVNITIDDRPVTVPKGTNLVEAAKQIGVEISTFCYHPGLSIAACCRQCLVDIVGRPKLAPACQEVALEGMKVISSSKKVLLAREQMLEFTLVNHPVDCPICDKAGECTLQKLYFDWDARPSRSIAVGKVHKPKRVDLGPTIVLDQERCILCTRCIRVCDEVAHSHQLEMANRGDREILTTAPGQQLDNPYSLNTVDVCPVGALTAKDFRFSMRAWELYSTDSVCNGCATGCNIEIHHREGVIYRLVPRHNDAVNKYWMCDEGRLTYKRVHEERAVGPLVNGLPSTWDRALATAVERLQPVLDKDRGAVGVVLSAGHANEDNWLLTRLAKEYLGITRVYAIGRPDVPERADKVLRVADVNPNRRGVSVISPNALDAAALEADLASGALKALIVLGSNPLSDEALAKARGLDALVAIAAHEAGLAQGAHVLLACADWAEISGTITNKDGRVQRLRPAFAPKGQALAGWEVVARLAKKLGAAFDHAHPKKVFQEMAAAVPAFAGAEWGRDHLPTIQLRFAASRG